MLLERLLLTRILNIVNIVYVNVYDMASILVVEETTGYKQC